MMHGSCPIEAALSNLPPLANERDLARALGIPFIDLESYTISPGILRKLSTRRAIRERCVPVVFNSRRVILAVDSMATIARLSVDHERLGVSRKRELSFVLATPRGLNRALEHRVETRE